MINLLPPDVKETYRYSRRNRVLSRWASIIVLCLAGAVLLTAGGYWYLDKSINNTQQQIADTQKQLQNANQTQVQKQVGDISNNLKLAVQVLSKEVLFSKLLTQLAAVTPNGVTLTNLSITQTQTGIDLQAIAANYGAATQFQVNLADPNNQIFSQADIENIDCSGGSGSKAYPCTVTIRALFAKNNPFLFINSSTKGSS